MSDPRLATIPFEHIEAEMAAFPLASEAGFRLNVTSLNPDVSSDDQLWRAAEKEIMEALPSVHLEEATTIRDKLWFQSTLAAENILQRVPLATYLRQLSESYLDELGRPTEQHVAPPEVTEPAYRAQEGMRPDTRLRWCWMCRALPPDMLRAARGVVGTDDDPFQLHPAMLRLLRDHGFAETHLHLGSALDYPLIWATLMYALTRSELRHDGFKSPGTYFNDGRELGTWLLYAAVVRLVLAKWLFNGACSGSDFSDLLTLAPADGDSATSTNTEARSDQFVKAHYGGDRDKLATHLSNLIGHPLDPIEFHRLARLLSEFIAGKFSEPQLATFAKQPLSRRFAWTRMVYLSLLDPPSLIRHSQFDKNASRAYREPECRDDVFRKDPLSSVVGWRPGMGSSPETLFIKASLDYLQQAGARKHDGDFANLFWQLMRIRCLLYRHLAERPLTPGLQWFMRFFARIKPVRKRVPTKVLVETAARLCGKDAGLRALEVRLGTDESEAACLKMVREVEEAGGKLRGIEVGAVFHFSRKRGGGWEQGRLNAHAIDHSYPATLGGIKSELNKARSKLYKDAGNPSGFRFARFYMEQRRHAQALVNVIRNYPCLLRTIRGIDLCTDEIGVPVWVMLPLMRWVREVGKQASIQLKRRGETAIPPLRTTVHAGEDFVHLMTGLRRIDHTVVYLQLEEGDRLGHALALGIDPANWCNRAGRVLQTCEERLFDLVWEWSCYAKHNVDVASRRLVYVRTEIVRLAQGIFKSSYNTSYTPEDIMAFFELLHTERELRLGGFPDRPGLRGLTSIRSTYEEGEEDSLQARYLLKSYLCDERVWRLGRTPMVVNFRTIQHEGEALSQLQDGLRRRIGALGLTVEINPSSNVVIGDLGHLEAHPLWRLHPVESNVDIPPLSVCIGSDNPLTLATTLPHEYQLLFDALLLRGFSHQVAMSWLDTVREAGMRTRFTLSRRVARVKQKLEPNILTPLRSEGPP